MSTIFHIARRADWDAARAHGAYRISTLGRTLDEVGFIHSSTVLQVAGVAARFYQGEQDLVLLTIETERLTAPLQLDPVGLETYPHIYGPLNLDAVVQVTPLVTRPDGTVELPMLPSD